MNVAVLTTFAHEPARGPHWKLPPSWAWSPLKPLCTFIGRGRGPTYVETGGVPVINQKCIRWHRLESRHFKLTSKQAFDRLSPELRLRAGDLLWNSTGTGTIGRALVYDGSVLDITADSHVTIVRPEHIDARFLGYFIETGLVQRLVVDANVGSTNQQELPRSFVENLSIPVPPLAEQRRIVARIDALFEEIAEGERALDAARKGLETYRRALLKAAVTGELTADWRETTDVDVSGQDIVRLIEHDLRLAKRRPAPSGEPAGLSRIPDTWAWSTLGTLASSVRNGTSAAPRSAPNGNEILRISAVRSMHIDATQIRYLNESQAAASADATVQSGDLLFTRYNGSADLVGVGAIYRGPQRFYPDKIIRVRLHAALEEGAAFVELAANAGNGRKHIAANIKTTAGQQGLSGESLKQTPIPVPPPKETIEILRRVASGLSAASDTQHVLDAEASDIQRLRQSVLKSAFEGRLVPQDESDEPAAVMLARLAASQESAPRPRRGRPRAVTP